MRILVEGFEIERHSNGVNVSLSGDELPISLQNKIARSMVKSKKPYKNTMNVIRVLHDYRADDYDPDILIKREGFYVSKDELGRLSDVDIKFFIVEGTKYIDIYYIFISENNNDHIRDFTGITNIDEVRYYGSFELVDEDNDLWVNDLDNVTKDEVIDILNKAVSEVLMSIS